MKRLILTRRTDGWYVCGGPDDIECGPYASKPIASEIRNGLRLFYLHCDEPGFVTSEKLKRRIESKGPAGVAVVAAETPPPRPQQHQRQLLPSPAPAARSFA